MVIDIRDEIFSNLLKEEFPAVITVERAGILAGIEAAVEEAKSLGLKVDYCLQDGSTIIAGEKVMLLRGSPKQIAQAEEILIGTMSMSSGIATATQQALVSANNKIRVVAGAWKKMPPQVKHLVRTAITIGGGKFRITDAPFIYIDKNYVRMFGGIQEALAAVENFKDMTKCIQLKGESAAIEIEAKIAVTSGADIIMIDTGNLADVEQVLCHLKRLDLRDKVQVAFGNGVKLVDIHLLAEKDIDIIDIGLQIIDAPLLDMRLDVLRLKNNRNAMLEVNLFEKTELWIKGIYLKDANLSLIAAVIAQTLHLEQKEVLVIDVQDNGISLDILKRKVNLINIAGKEQALLQNLAQVENVVLDKECHIRAEGILGVIAMNSKDVDKALERVADGVTNVKNKVARRVKVFPTGFELIKGYIEDTNSPMIKRMLENRGFKVNIGEILDDDIQLIQHEIRTAIDDGYGLIITTGGTGAEHKDCTVEAVLNIDQCAITPYIVKFQKGCGRHVKNGVRIAVGQVEDCLIISLPGPNSEVAVAMDTIIPLIHKVNKQELGDAIANNLQGILKDKNSC